MRTRIPMFLDYFESPEELAYVVENTELQNPYYEREVGLSSKQDFKLLREGEDIAIQNFANTLEVLEHLQSNYKKVYNVCGSKVDMSRAMTGNPKSMVSLQKRNTRSREVSLILDMTMPWSTSRETIQRIGQNLVASIQQMDMLGNRMSLYACYTGADRNKVNMVLCKLKSMGEPLELMKISYALQNPNFLRHICFEWHKTDKRIYKMDGLGHALNFDYSSDEVSKALSYELGEKVLYIPFTKYKSDRYDIEEVFKDLDESLDKIDKTVFL